MSLNSYKRKDREASTVVIFIRGLVEFAWRQWAQLGVSSVVTFQDNWTIDPEALLLFTLEIGRYAPRLFDEVMDWCIQNDESISIQRLKSLLKAQSTSDDLRRTVAAFGAVMAAHAQKSRWGTLETVLDPKRSAQDEAPLPFFLAEDGAPLPQFGKTDALFLQAGFLRSPINLRKLSVPPTMDTPACLLLKLRALFGLDPRAEAVAYLLARKDAGGREVARATGYSPAAMHNALTRLAQGQFLFKAGRQGYEIDDLYWRFFLYRVRPLWPQPLWIDWMHVLPALVKAVDTLRDQDEAASPYLRASSFLRLDSALGNALAFSGLPNPFASPCTLESVMECLPHRLLEMTRKLNHPEETESQVPPA